jgi:nucleoside-diphosphate-sugar epimerase
MKILVTGATGFIGGRIVPYLLERNYEVSITVRSNSDVDNLGDHLKNVDIVTLEENFTTIGLVKSLDKIKPDVVVHLASLYISEHKLDQVESLINSNVLFGVQLLEAMDFIGCKKLVNIGTSWQYYNGAEYEPVNLYAATKQAFIDIAQYYIKARGLQVIDLKLFDTYGVNDNRKKIIPFLIENLDANETIALSAGDQKINIVYVDDVLSCIEMAVSHLYSKVVLYEEYAVGSSEVLSLKELVRLIENISKKSLSIKWGGKEYRDREVMVPWNNGERLPGWEPKISLKEGLKKLLGPTQVSGS